MIDYDVIVVGGGMVGMAFALDFAKKQNQKIAIIDNSEIKPTILKDFHTRVSSINIASEEYLKELGVWQDIERKKSFSKVKVWDQNSQGSINFDSQEEDLTHFGHIIENDIIKLALYKSIKKSNITIIKDNVINIEKDNNFYKIISTDKTITCSLLIGADGANSKIRKLAGIEYRENNYEQKAIIANIVSKQKFNNTISQRFLDNSIIAILPMSENKASIVYSCNNDIAKTLINLSDKEFNEKLNIATEYFFGELELISKRNEFPITEKSAKNYFLDNLALIGDAAHNIHPLAGQGVNLGFADSKTLNIKLYENKDKDIKYSEILEEYAKDRKIQNEIMAKTMTTLNWVYKNNDEPIRIIRGLGMNFINNNQIIKSFLQKQAVGK